jgi:eukaryotic-like serine/threonine-protein kinase
MATQQPQFRIGGYELVRLLGRGGMGEVWLASDTRADRLVAIKFIKPGYLDDPAVRTRFLNEARTLGRLEQDRIVTLYNVVEDGTSLALVLRFIDGASLADRIDAQGALPLDFVAASARDILPALGFAHEHGIIHRDIKPQNVLVDKRGRSFLTDFGIAIGDFAERGTVTGFAVGTPHYMSPEQIQTPRSITVQDGGHRSDIYSYGVVLYEMLTGRVPFGGDSGVEEIYRVQHAHCVEPPPPLREVNSSVPPALEDLVLCCLAKKADERPQSCAELLEQFNAALEGKAEPVAVRRAAAHVATIVERPRNAAPVPAERAAAAAPASAPTATARKRGIPKAAWLGAGALVIAGGISFAVFSSNQPQHVASTTTQQPNTDSPKQPEPAPKSLLPAKKDTQPLEPPRETKTVATRPATPPILTTTTRQPSVDVPGKSLPATNPIAERDYTQAADMARKGLSCQALDSVKQALQLDPSNQKYLVLQGQVASACEVITGAENYYEQADEQFKQGNYCEGKSAIDEAVRRVPNNAKYIEKQRQLAKGCNIQ